MEKGYNIAFPLQDDNRNNLLFKKTKTTKDGVKSKLLLLLYTQKGTRYYKPDYGTNLRKFLFDPNDQQLRTDLEDDVRNTVGKYLPKIKITNFSYQDEKVENINTLLIKINFTYSDNIFSDQDTVSLRFNLAA